MSLLEAGYVLGYHVIAAERNLYTISTRCIQKKNALGSI